MTEGFFRLTLVVKVEKDCSSSEAIESSKDEELTLAKAQMRWVKRLEFISETGNPLPENQ